MTSILVRITRGEAWSAHTVVWRRAWIDLSRVLMKKEHKSGTDWTSLPEMLLRA